MAPFSMIFLGEFSIAIYNYTSSCEIWSMKNGMN